MSNRFAEILSFVPDPHGGFRQDRDYGWSTGSTWCSSEGMDMLVQQARIMEHWAGHFDALPLLRCMHGLTQSGFELTWSINDYICEPMKDPAHIDFMLAGWHEEPDEFCCAAWAHSVPAGLVVMLDGTQREEASR